MHHEISGSADSDAAETQSERLGEHYRHLAEVDADDEQEKENDHHDKWGQTSFFHMLPLTFVGWLDHSSSGSVGVMEFWSIENRFNQHLFVQNNEPANRL